MNATTLILLFSIWLCCVKCQHVGDVQLMHEWGRLKIDWPSDAARNDAIRKGTFQVEKNVIAGVKVYKNNVFVTVPRWRTLTGIPLTLAKVITNQGESKLHPYPNWQAQTVGDCSALQYAQSMEIDSNTGRMYVIDTGRIGLASASVTPRNLCPAKLVVFDLHTDSQIASWEFPDNVVNRTNNFLNDIALDYVDGELRHAYITDLVGRKLIVFNFATNTSHSISDLQSMSADGGNGTTISINGNDYGFSAGIDGIAVSPNFDYVYFCPLGSYNLFALPTASARLGTTDGLRFVGRKISQTDGMVFSQKRLYYGALGLNAVYSWNPQTDVTKQGTDITQVNLITQKKLVSNDETMQWPDTFAIDENGWLWFVSNRLHLFSSGTMNFTGSDVNMRLWRVFINESSYLQDAQYRTNELLSIVG